MRNLDNNRVEGYVKKHNYLKRWISIMLVVALLVTTVTMYSLNKSANALSGDNADDVGMTLEGENVEEFASGNTETGDSDSGDSDSVQNSENTDNSSEENVEENEAEESVEASEDNGSDAADASSSSEESSENADANAESNNSEENGTDSSSEESSTDATSDSEEADSSEVVDNGDGTEDIAGQNSEGDENKDTVASDKVLEDSNDIELTEDVVLKVSYVSEEGEAIADEKEINLSDSLDFTTEAPKQEGYEFLKAEIDGTEIRKITAKQDANGYKYYVVTVGESTVVSDNIEEMSAEDNELDGSLAEETASEEKVSEETEVSENIAEDVDSDVISADQVANDEKIIKENKTVVLTYKLVEAERTEYIYENDEVRVIATLEKASAIPDDAEFVVTEVTSETQGYDYDAYMKALNDGEESTLANHNEHNTILYDVAFMVDKKDEEGNVIEGEKVEYQPEEGSVSIKFEFLNKQLEDLATASEADGIDNQDDIAKENEAETGIEVTHMPLNEEIKNTIDSTAQATDLEASDINTVPVDANVSPENETASMSLDNFSIVSMSTIKIGDDGTFIYDKNGRRLTYKLNNKTDAFVDSKYYNANLALGIAGNFHVVAFDTAEFTTHVNGNVLAKNFKTNADFGTRNIENELSYVQNLLGFNNTMASAENHALALGSKANVGINDENFFQIDGKKTSTPFNIIQDKDSSQNPYINISKVSETIKGISDALASTSDGAVTRGLRRDNNSFYSFVYTGDGGAGYVNLKASEWNYIVNERALEFYFPKSLPNQAIIINIDCSDSYYINWPNKASDVIVAGKAVTRGETPNVNDGRIVYNFVNANGKTIKAKEVFGQIIAIGANLEVDKGDGNFIAQNVKITGETHRRDFIGTTTKSGAIVFTGTKTIDGEAVPSEFANGKFQFDIYKYDNNKGWVYFSTTYNEGNEIKFDVTNAITGVGKYYFRVNEVVPKNKDDKIPGMTYDTRYFMADVDVTSKQEYTGYGVNTRYYINRINYRVANCANISVNSQCTSSIVFDNKTAPKTGMLRIHKMVVNDYGSDFIRDATGTALLSKVTFRITNNDTKNYIVVEGFTGHAGDKGNAVEFDSKTHQPNGKQYVVTYNQSAQWTIEGLAFGTYSVEEVADGYTFSYDMFSNSSSAIETNNLSRVTKYDVTVDAEESNAGRKSPLYGTGGNNYRAVFSKDIPNKVDSAPTNVVVGDRTETVQVCNYYSIPIGPIQVSKNFSGGDWNDKMAFSFKLEPTGYSARVSEGGAVTLKSQPMPLDAKGNIVDTATVTGADATRNNNGTYSAIAKFGSIPFRYEGTYYYKITEIDTGIDGVQYDLNKVYYVKIEVSKKYTTFSKTYTYEHMTHPAKYRADTTIPNEDFFYLGADVTYSDVEDFKNVLATCELKLGSNPDTANPDKNVFIVEYSNGTSVFNTSFNNTLQGRMTVKKEWKGSDGSDEANKHEQALTITILQKPEKGTSVWSEYGTIQLTPENGWAQSITDLPIFNENGVRYQYCVKESDDFLATFEVTYSYNGNTYQANGQTKKIKVDGSNSVTDPGYKMKVGKDGINYGEVTITNRSLVVNTLPNSGGEGTVPYTMAGAALIILATAAMFVYRRKKKV